MPFEKPCDEKMYQKKYRSEHRDELKKYAKVYYKKNRDRLRIKSKIRRLANLSRYRRTNRLAGKTPHGRAIHNNSSKAWSKRNREKKRAYRAVYLALKSGRISRGPCEKCGTSKNVHAHHSDYQKKLEVTWLCWLCHEKIHHNTGVA